jgi:hypothetical protein
MGYRSPAKLLAIAVASAVEVPIYVLVQRLSKQRHDTPYDIRGTKVTAPRRVRHALARR